jgi:hypothetical protein
MSSTLAAFQDGFARALLDPEAEMPAAFAVYRNTVMKGCIDALRANYPAVARLVGEEWFRAAAALFVRAQPPRAPMLALYGEGFEGFLASFAPAAELPYLPAVARLDRFWSESHLARDEAALGTEALARMDLEQLGRQRLRPHAAARWSWFALPACSIWSRQRAESDEADEIDWRAEGALVTRPDGAVRWEPLSQGGCALLDACARGLPLGAAAEAALAADSATDLSQLIARLLAAGAFADSLEESS